MDSPTKTARFIHGTLDILLVRFIILGIIIVPLLKEIFPSLYSGENIYNRGYIFYIIDMIVFFLYYFLFELLSGTTIAKYFTGSKVSMVDGSKPKALNIFNRSICRIIPFDPISFLAGNGWHDSLSNTTVIDYTVPYVTEHKINRNPIKNYFAININRNLFKFKSPVKLYVALIISLLILVITNPSHQDFRAFRHIAPTNYQNRTGKEANYFVCSVYSDDFDHQRYIGFLGNFYKL